MTYDIVSSTPTLLLIFNLFFCELSDGEHMLSVPPAVGSPGRNGQLVMIGGKEVRLRLYVAPNTLLPVEMRGVNIGRRRRKRTTS